VSVEWVEVAAAAVERVVAERDDLFAVKVSSFGNWLIPISRETLAGVHPVRLRDAIDRTEQAPIDLLPRLDDAGRRAWNALRATKPQESEIADALQARLAADLDDVIPLVMSTSWVSWWLVERHVDPARLAAAELTAQPKLRPRSRAELATMLEADGARPELAELAGWGLALVPGGKGASRLGGRPEFDGEWPPGHTHLASIALDELPEFEGRDLLPRDGSLVFFGDFREEIWPPPSRVVYVPPGTSTTVVSPAEEPPRGEYEVPLELEERRVRFEPVLTLPIPTNLEDSERDALFAFHELLEDTPDHLLLGHPVYIQDDPPEDGRISLLQMNWDEPLNFMYADGGSITFRGHPEDIRAGRFDRIYVELSSS
jgi:hypothetical protein